MAELPAAGQYLEVEVAYGEPDRQIIVALRVPAGTTAAEAAAQAHLERQFEGLDVAASALGIFGRRVASDQALSDGDRVEIYRPLRADPKEVRRQLARLGKTMGRVKRDGDED